MQAVATGKNLSTVKRQEREAEQKRATDHQKQLFKAKERVMDMA